MWTPVEARKLIDKIERARKKIARRRDV